MYLPNAKDPSLATRQESIRTGRYPLMRSGARAANPAPTGDVVSSVPTTRKRVGAKGKPRIPANTSVPSLPVEESLPGTGAQSLAVTTLKVLQINEGVYALRIGSLAGPSREISGIALPAVQIVVPSSEQGASIEIVACFPNRRPWFGQEGGTAIVRSPRGGGQVLLASYGAAGELAAALAFDVRRLDGSEDIAIDRMAATVDPSAGTLSAAAIASTGEISTEILLHIELAGDRVFSGNGWVGALGRKLRIEGFSIRPLEKLLPVDIEMQGFGVNVDQTPWVAGGAFCGTRGRGVGLTGFAVRLAPHLREHFDAIYEGSFFAGGVSGLKRNGEPCKSSVPNDPLEAINVRLVGRGAASHPVNRSDNP